MQKKNVTLENHKNPPKNLLNLISDIISIYLLNLADCVRRYFHSILRSYTRTYNKQINFHLYYYRYLSIFSGSSSIETAFNEKRLKFNIQQSISFVCLNLCIHSGKKLQFNVLSSFYQQYLLSYKNRTTYSSTDNSALFKINPVELHF